MKQLGRLVLFASLMIACTRSLPFDKERWSAKNDIGGYPWRADMLNDLEAKQILDGKHVRDAIGLLGAPDFTEGNERLWTITIDYGMDIDPVYLKYLVVIVDTDSMVVAHSIREIEH